MRVRKCSHVLLVFPHQGFRLKRKNLSISISPMKIRERMNDEQRKDERPLSTKTRSDDIVKKRTPPEIGFASKENLFS